MPNLASAFKEEITRLARKEAKTLTKPLQKASAQFRRDIAELKRQNAKSRVEITRLSKGVIEPIAGSETGPLRFSVRSVKAQRKHLGISAADFGKLIGVSDQSVYKWEHGTSRPRNSQLAGIAALRSLGKQDARKRLEELSVKGAKGRKKKTI